MKKILTLIAALSLSMIIHGQSFSYKNSDDSYVDPKTGTLTIVRHRNIEETKENEQHLMFEGIPINGTVSSFTYKLKQKGIKVSKGNGDSFIYKGINTSVFVNRDIESNTVSSVTVWYIFKDNDKGLKEAGTFYNSFIKNLKLKYLCKEFSYYDNNDEYSGTLSVYDITSGDGNHTKLGEITINDFYSNGDYLITVEYSDNLNSLANNIVNYPQNNTDLHWFDFSHLLEDGSKCFLSFTGSSIYVKYDYKISSSLWETYNMIFKDNDKDIMIWLLTECKNPQVRRELFHKYLECADYKREENNWELDTYIYHDILDDATRLYFDEYNKKLLAQRKQRTKLTVSQFFRIMCPQLFTEKEYEYMDTFFPQGFLSNAGKIASNASSSDKFMEQAAFATKQELNMQ